MNSFCTEIKAIMEDEGCLVRIIPIHAGRHEILVDGNIRGNITVDWEDILDIKTNFEEERDNEFVQELLFQVRED